MADFFLQNVIRRRPLPPFFCHACSHRFGPSSEDSASSMSEDPVCPKCGSDFVERLEQAQEEQLTTGGGEGATSAPSSSTTTSSATITVSRPGLRSTTYIEEDVPMETLPTADDPEPELIGQDELPRRRPAASGTTTTSTTTTTTSTGMESNTADQNSDSDDDMPEAARRAGGPYVRIRAPRRGVPLARMIYEHIENMMTHYRERDRAEEERQRERAEGTDGGDDINPPAARRRRQHSSPPRDIPPQQESGNDDSSSGTDLHFAVGLPWYLMLHGRDHARWSQPAHSRGQPRPHNPQVPRFGMPLVIGINSGPVHGTPGDYAWGPSGLDDIITQMLANLEDSGPPPAKEEKIAELPKIVATEEDLRTCAECSVCKERFTVGEELLKIPCNHLYHPDCVLPWLKLHDTCPTCRYHLNTGKYEQET